VTTRPKDLANQVRRFGDWFAGRSPLYGALCPRIAEDPDLLALIALAQSGQPPVNMLFGAVQDQLLRNPAVPLASHYPELANGRAPIGDAFAAFRCFALDHLDAIAATMRSRRVQTNEPARTALFLPALALAYDARPLALLEIGASAGLNLLMDRYAFDYGDGRLGPANAPATFDCEVRGDGFAPPRAVPPIAWRLGLDVRPIDVASPAERRWLRALVWPGQGERVTRLETVLDIAAADPPPVRAGDASRDLDAAVAGMPGDTQAIVLHAFTLNQLDDAARRRFRAALWRAARTRPLVRIGVEHHGGRRPALTIERFADGRAERRRLARCDPHGAWLEWRG